MKAVRRLFRSDDDVCPWWLAWTFDNPLRRYFQDPEKIAGPYVQKGMTVADIGCGMGYFSIAMAKMAGETGTVIAVDLQQKMLDLMQRRAEKAGVIPRIRPLLATGDDIGIKEPVDFVLAFWMVHEVRDIPRFFAQVSAVLKKTGKVLIAEPKMHVSRREFQATLEHARKAGLQISDVPTVSISRAVVLSKKAGCQKAQVDAD